jgi:signal transduction histidine kinase
VDIAQVVQSGVEELRAKVQHLIPDLAAWRANLEAVYADPYSTQEDELTLLQRPPVTLRRFTGPVLDAQGEVRGRLWTFLDITREVRQRRMRDVLSEVSLFYANDPTEVYYAVVNAISAFYGGATVWIGVRQGDGLTFRAAAGPGSECLTEQRMSLEQTLAQTVLRTDSPLALAPIAEYPEHAARVEAHFGTRFLGVPFYDNNRCPAGILALADHNTETAFEEDEIRFLSLLSMRISAEVAREAYLQERLAEQRATLQRQQADLIETQDVLAGMNGAFALIGSVKTQDQLLDRQLNLLIGRMGCESAAILLTGTEGTTLCGRLRKRGQKRSRAVTWSLAEMPELACWLRESSEPFRYETRLLPEGKLLLGSAAYALARLELAGGPQGLLILGRSAPPEPGNRLHFAHLEAVREQVALLISTFLLQSQLVSTHRELSATQEKLVQSEKLSIVGTLAVTTAHDIRNILTPLQVELMFGRANPQEALETVQNTLTRLMVLTHRLLAYAHPRRTVHMPVALAEIVEEALALTATQIRQAGVQREYDADDALPTITGDRHRLEHLFINLILNAVQAMDAQGGILRIALRKASKGIQAEVADTGRGIPPEALPHLFEPFYSTRPEGFGLGLFGCKRIVEEHDGTISVETQLGAGTLFRIFLPCQTQAGVQRPQKRRIRNLSKRNQN